MRVEISYKELRRASGEVIQFVKGQSGDEIITFKTEIEGDLLITGDEAGMFMEEFASQFLVDLSQFRFDNHFQEEGFELTEFWIIPFFVLARIVQGMCLGLSFLISRRLYAKLNKFSLIKLLWKYRKERKSIIRVEDLIISVILGRFQMRVNTEIVLT